jgi:phosphotriesterase-related protein
MPQIMTVLGPISPQDLGFTSMHEHILYDGSVFRRRFGAYLSDDVPVKPDDPVRLDNLGILKHGFIMCWDAIMMEDVDLLAAELGDFKASGGSAVVDMSTPGMRVNPELTRQVSEKSGVHIIITTGLYSRDSWPERFHTMSLEDMRQYMLQEIEEGLEGTTVKPGHLKVAIEEDFCEPEVNALRAAAQVANETGFSLTVHQGMLLGADAGNRIADILVKEGMDLGQVVIAHNDGKFCESSLKTVITDQDSWRLNLDTSRELLQRGLNLSLDCFGHYWDVEPLGINKTTDWQRLAGLIALIKEGYASQLVLGMDTFVKILLRRFGGEGYCRLTNYVVPWLREVGISEDDIRLITVDNPARILTY